MHRLQFHQLVAQGFNDAPATSRRTRRHGQRAGRLDPSGNLIALSSQRINAQEAEPLRYLAEVASLGPCHQSQGDNTHRFLRIIHPVAEAHACRTKDLQFAKPSSDYMRL